MKKSLIVIILFAALTSFNSYACTNFIISRGASADGSTMITYAADAHVLYGELYFRPAADYPEGAMMDIYEWDTGKFMGKIRQARHTYSVVGNMNEHQVAIGETTYGGRHELYDSTAIIDYGSLMYIVLQRAKTAREAIKVMSDLLTEYGYASSGESFSISDPNEAWIMDLIGKGPANTGAVWAARKIPDGYISGHANHARITAFPLKGSSSISSKKIKKIFNPEIENVYAYDMISLAREKGYFDGKDEEFSFSDVYAPLDFGGARFCEARVWSAFNRVNPNMEQYLNYAMGYELDGERMPLWIKPDKKLSVKDVMELMRDHYEGSPMDMTADIGGGAFNCGVRWRPLTWKVNGKTYFNERATSTQQTGFSFVAQSRNWLPDPVGGILWFSVDDTYSTVYAPMYCGITEVPWAYAHGNGDIMEFTTESAFWVFNQLSNFAYSRASEIYPDIRQKQAELEQMYFDETKKVDENAAKMISDNEKEALKYLTEYSVNTGNNLVSTWKDFYGFIFSKYMDGNIKTAREVPSNHIMIPPEVKQPGYGEDWYRLVIEKTGDKFLMPEQKGDH